MAGQASEVMDPVSWYLRQSLLVLVAWVTPHARASGVRVWRLAQLATCGMLMLGTQCRLYYAQSIAPQPVLSCFLRCVLRQFVGVLRDLSTAAAAVHVWPHDALFC